MIAKARQQKRRACSICERPLDAAQVAGVRGGVVHVYTCRNCDRLHPRPLKRKGR